MRTRLKIKEIAEAQDMSMTKLQNRSEIAYGTIRKLFRNPYDDGVTLATLCRIAQALGVETRDLIEDVADEK